jgi:hypothetical protein
MLYAPVSQKGKPLFLHSAPFAEEFIAYYQYTPPPTEAHQALLAAAHSTLACRPQTSFSRSKMHVNSAIVILKQITQRKQNWYSLIARTYFLRAELLEEESDFYGAAIDYLLAVEALEDSISQKLLSAEDIYLLAKAYLNTANLLILHCITREDLALSHPLFYINRTLESLNKIKNFDKEHYLTQVSAHTIAGIALSHIDLKEAETAFQLALLLSYQINGKETYPLLAELYHRLGLLHEQQYKNTFLHLKEYSSLEEVKLYFNLSEFFRPVAITEEEIDFSEIEQLFETIYRLLDPFIWLPSKRMLVNAIDALVYLCTSVVEKTLPNLPLSEQLFEPPLLASYKQHLFWLLEEAYHREHPGNRLFNIANPTTIDTHPDLSNIVAVIEKRTANNIHYL